MTDNAKLADDLVIEAEQLRRDARSISQSADKLEEIAAEIEAAESEPEPDDPPVDPDPPGDDPPGEVFTQPGHGFAVRQYLYYREDDGSFRRVQYKDEGSHVVTEVVSRDSFRAVWYQDVVPPGTGEPPSPPENVELVGRIEAAAVLAAPYREIVVLGEDVRAHRPGENTPVPGQTTEVLTWDSEGDPARVLLRIPAKDLDLDLYAGAGYESDPEPEPLEGPALEVRPLVWIQFASGAKHTANQLNTLEEYRDANVVRDTEFYRFEEDGAPSHWSLGAHVVTERRRSGVVLLEYLISNGLRDADDFNGHSVAGDVFYEAIGIMPPDGYLLIQYPERTDQAGVGADGTTAWIHKPREDGKLHYLGSQRMTRRKMALVPKVADTTVQGLLLAEADEALRNRCRCATVRGQRGYVDGGGYGPQGIYLPDCSDERLVESGNQKGLLAVNAKTTRQLARELGEIFAGDESFGLLRPRGDAYLGNEHGGWEIQFACAAFQDDAAHELYPLESAAWIDRAIGAMFDSETGKPLGPWDFAARNGGRQPWTVNRTHGSGSQVPWRRQNAKPWNHGACDYKADQDRRNWVDHAHFCRPAHGLKFELYLQGSTMARFLIHTAAEWFALDPSPFKSGGWGDWKTAPGLLAQGAADPGGGSGALGRQIGWPLDLWAMAYASGWSADNDPGEDLTDRHEWLVDLGVALDSLVSPAGGTRRRISRAYGNSNWAHADPGPNLENTSDRICEQTFEATHVALGALGLWRVTGLQSYFRVFERIAHGHVGEGRPLLGKWYAYGRVAKDAQGKTRTAELFPTPEYIPGGSGRPHIVNLAGLAAQYLSNPRPFLSTAARWLGLSGSATEEQILERCWKQAEPAGEIDDWRLSKFWYGEALTGYLKARN